MLSHAKDRERDSKYANTYFNNQAILSFAYYFQNSALWTIHVSIKSIFLIISYFFSLSFSLLPIISLFLIMIITSTVVITLGKVGRKNLAAQFIKSSSLKYWLRKINMQMKIINLKEREGERLTQ